MMLQAYEFCTERKIDYEQTPESATVAAIKVNTLRPLFLRDKENCTSTVNPTSMFIFFFDFSIELYYFT